MKHFILILLVVFAFHKNSVSSVKLEVDNKSAYSHRVELMGRSVASHQDKKMKYEQIFDIVLAKLGPQYRADAKPVTDVIIAQALKYKMDPMLIISMIDHESKFNPIVKGRHGEIGLMQIKPSTALWIAQKYKINFNKKHSLFDMKTNIKMGTAYLSYLRTKYNNEPIKYLTAYNMGPSNTNKLNLKTAKLTYLSKVMSKYKTLTIN